MGEVQYKPKVGFLTLGCAKNEVDSDRMRSIVGTSGLFELVDDIDLADVIVVNTCSFLLAAVEEGIETTLSLVQEKVGTDASERKIVMAGCIPSRYGTALTEEMHEVAAFVPCDREDDIVDVLAKVFGLASVAEPALPNVARTIQSSVAYIKISDGCDRFCSFCAIPYIRGRYASRTLEEIVAEARFLVEGGVRELVLIGQDTGVWGSDLSDGRTLADLLESVAEVVRPVDGIVRVLYLQPEGLDRRLVGVIRDNPNVAKYIDMPLQHSSEHVLKLMNRAGNHDEFIQTVNMLRETIPGVTLRTTAMVGFPGETQEDFEDLMSFLEEAQFDYTAVFSYSQEEGTAAANLPNQIEESVKLEREQAVIDLTEAIGFASAASRIGTTCRVLVDSVEYDEDGGCELIGRAEFQAPDSDGVVHLGQIDAAMGDFVNVTIEDAACYELFADESI